MHKAITKPGYFIQIDGIDGCGKSGAVLRVVSELRNRGIDAIKTREPGGTTGADDIRALLVTGATDRFDDLTETALFLAARRDLRQRVIEPALANGTWIVSDRGDTSTEVYQGIVKGVGLDTVRALTKILVGEREADLVIILDIDHRTALDRALGRGGDETRFERLGEDFHRLSREGFLSIARSNPAKFAIISATGTPEEVSFKVLQEVENRFLTDHQKPSNHQA